jgi:hypothetical protein
MFYNRAKVEILSLCVTKHHAMKTHWGSRCITPRILNLGTRYSWVGLRAGLDCKEEKPAVPAGNRTPIVVTILTELPRLTLTTGCWGECFEVVGGWREFYSGGGGHDLYTSHWSNQVRWGGRVLGKWRYSSMHSLNLALDGGEWSATRPGRFIPKKRAPCTYWIGGWVGPRRRNFLTNWVTVSFWRRTLLHGHFSGLANADALRSFRQPAWRDDRPGHDLALTLGTTTGHAPPASWIN